VVQGLKKRLHTLRDKGRTFHAEVEMISIPTHTFVRNNTSAQIGGAKGVNDFICRESGGRLPLEAGSSEMPGLDYKTTRKVMCVKKVLFWNDTMLSNPRRGAPFSKTYSKKISFWNRFLKHEKRAVARSGQAPLWTLVRSNITFCTLGLLALFLSVLFW
jgi:hypothetical protein